MTYDAMRIAYDSPKSKVVNRVYMVVEVETTPYGEPMGDGATLGVFRSRK